MTYAKINELFRGYAGNSARMDERVSWGTPFDPPNAINKLPAKCIATLGLFGISSICLATLLDPNYLAAVCAESAIRGIDNTPEQMIENLYIAGGGFFGFSILGSVITIGLSTVFGCLEEKNNFGLACTKMELAGKFLKIFTEPVLCILCTLAQALYMLTYLVLTLASLVLFPVYERLHLKGPISNFNEVGYAYFDMINQALFSVISVIVNAGDFLFSLKSTLVGEPVNQGDEPPVNPGENDQSWQPFEPFTGTSYRISEDAEVLERISRPVVNRQPQNQPNLQQLNALINALPQDDSPGILVLRY